VRTTKPAAAIARIVPAAIAATSAPVGAQEGSLGLAETGVAVGRWTIPVVTSAGAASGSCTTPVEISAGAARVSPVTPVLISDGVAVGAAAGAVAPSPLLTSDEVATAAGVPAEDPPSLPV
jgi:hypothetical protein